MSEHCLKCGNEITENSEYCNRCGTKTNKKTINTKKIKAWICPQCGQSNNTKPIKTSFVTGYKTYDCDNCHFVGGIPLSISGKIIYTAITIIAILVVILILLGNQGRLGLIAFIAPFLLYKDSQLKKKINEAQVKNGTKPEIFIAEDKFGVLKGVIVSLFLFFIAFILSSIPGMENALGEQPTSNSQTLTNAMNPFYSTEGQFKINFPGNPQQSSSTEKVAGMSVPMTQYSLTNSNDEYFVQVVKYPVKASELNSKAVLEGSVTGSVNSDNTNKLLKSVFVQHGSYPAIDYEIYNGQAKEYMYGRNILVGSNLYTVMMGSVVENPANYSTFLNSFELLNNK